MTESTRQSSDIANSALAAEIHREYQACIQSANDARTAGAPLSINEARQVIANPARPSLPKEVAGKLERLRWELERLKCQMDAEDLEIRELLAGSRALFTDDAKYRLWAELECGIGPTELARLGVEGAA